MLTLYTNKYRKEMIKKFSREDQRQIKLVKIHSKDTIEHLGSGFSLGFTQNILVMKQLLLSWRLHQTCKYCFNAKSQHLPKSNTTS